MSQGQRDAFQSSIPIPVMKVINEVPKSPRQQLLERLNRYLLPATFFLLCATLIGGALAYTILGYWPVKTITINNVPMPVEQGVVAPGQPVPYVVSYCPHTDKDTLLAGRLTFPDRGSYVYADRTTPTAKTCGEARPQTFVVPQGFAAVCEVQLHVTYSYYINFVRGYETVEAVTEPFCIGTEGGQ